jgi:hypothetical protein
MVVAAQRARGWGEVARRPAHEIKTRSRPSSFPPSAHMKLAENQPPEQAAVLDKRCAPSSIRSRP